MELGWLESASLVGCGLHELVETDTLMESSLRVLCCGTAFRGPLASAPVLHPADWELKAFKSLAPVDQNPQELRTGCLCESLASLSVTQHLFSLGEAQSVTLCTQNNLLPEQKIWLCA